VNNSREKQVTGESAMDNEIRNEMRKDDGILTGEGLTTSDLAGAGDSNTRKTDVDSRATETQAAETRRTPGTPTGAAAATGAVIGGATGAPAGAATGAGPVTGAAVGAGTGAAAGAATAPARGEEEHGPLFASEEANNLRARWDAIQVGFVDEPRKAVEDADRLVAAAMKRLAEMFADERQKLEHQWDRGDNVSTEDLRVALRRYRSFFSRLLNI
jgi:hypothetical protein